MYVQLYLMYNVLIYFFVANSSKENKTGYIFILFLVVFNVTLLLFLVNHCIVTHPIMQNAKRS